MRSDDAQLVCALALAAFLIGFMLCHSAHAEVSECNARSVEGCLCVDEAKVLEWRAKSMAYDSLQKKQPIICSPGDDTGTKSIWAALTALAVIAMEAMKSSF